MKQVQTFKTQNPRLVFFYPAFLLLFLALIIGLAWRQLGQKNQFESQEMLQSMRRILQPGTRGNIYDRNGTLLVGNRPLFSAAVYLGELRGIFRKEYLTRIRELRESGTPINYRALRQETRIAVLQRYLNQINRIIGRDEVINEKKLARHFSQRLLLPLPLLEDLTPEEYARLTEQLPVESPIQVFTDNARYYPYGSAAAHVLGYVAATFDIPREGVPGETLTTFSQQGKTGKSGLEAYFDEALQGTSGGDVWRVDPVGYQFKHLNHKPASQGESLTTSLDINIQLAAERALGDNTGAVVVIEVKTGEVLALVSKPNYDLNQLSPYIPSTIYNQINESGGWLNRATQGLYPPGSPFKLITTLAGFRGGYIEETTLTDCTGKHQVGNRAFPCNRRWGHGLLSVDESIGTSCNIIFYQKSLEMGPIALGEEARFLGLAEPTGIEIPFESKSSLIPDPDWKKMRIHEPWRPGDTANMSIGQGFLLITPLQMACFAASLARGDLRTYPTLLHNENRKPLPDKRNQSPMGITESQYQTILSGMEKATLEGTAKRARLHDINIASKTGTAQTTAHGKERDIAWYLGFAPLEDPQIAVVVAVEETEDNQNFGGGSTATPIARKIIAKALRES